MTSAGVFLLVLCHVVCNGGFTKAAMLNFNSSLENIQPPLTPDLSMTCEFNSSLITGPVVNNIIGRRDVSQTGDDVSFLTSLIVERNGNNHVASISEHIPARAILDVGQLSVKGHIDGSAGYLQLTWQYPGHGQAGEYTCKATGYTSLGVSVTLSSSLEILNQTAKAAQMVSSIHDLQVELQQVKAELQQIRQDHMTDIHTLMRNDTALSASVGRARHVESGSLDCGASKYWKEDGTGFENNYINQTFASVYDKAPAVQLGVKYLYGFARSNYEFYVDLITVTTKGFTMRCRADADDRIYGLSVFWVSIPN